MRKHYLDNVRWVTVLVVVLYHVLYMYNGQGIPGVLGKITDVPVQYWDLYEYIVYPWIMPVLFMVSGICSRIYLDNHTEKEFLGSRTSKLLVPSTIGLFAFQFIQGYVNTALSGILYAPDIPLPFRVAICIMSGVGVLWYIQLLWVYSVLLLLIRKIEKDRLWNACRNCGLAVLIALFVPVFGCARILNTPIVVVYRVGLYLAVFLIGYFVLSHDEVVEVLKKYFFLFLAAALATCIAFCVKYFGTVYSDAPVNRTVIYVADAYFTSLAIIGGFARFFDFSTPFTRWMTSRSFGLYVFHYLGISAFAVFVAATGVLPAWAVYILSLVCGLVSGYGLYAVISRIPGYRWAVLGIRGCDIIKQKEIKQ